MTINHTLKNKEEHGTTENRILNRDSLYETNDAIPATPKVLYKNSKVKRAKIAK